MTSRQIYDFAVSQMEWHKKQINFDRSQIAFCNRELKRTRKEDKELQEYALSNNPDRFTVETFSGNYVGSETRKYIKERAKWYRSIKSNEKKVAHYQKMADDMLKYIG